MKRSRTSIVSRVIFGKLQPGRTIYCPNGHKSLVSSEEKPDEPQAAPAPKQGDATLPDQGQERSPLQPARGPHDRPQRLREVVDVTRHYKRYEVWDDETANNLGEFFTPEEAIRFVLRNVSGSFRSSIYIIRDEDRAVHQIWPKPERWS